MEGDVEDAMEGSNGFKEKRKYPRALLNLPFEYRVEDLPYAHGGVVVDASEAGLLIHSVEDMPIGLKLNIVLLFAKGFELTNLEVSAEIIRKDLRSYNGSKGYQYGLKIIRIVEEDRSKLKQLLSG
jgi:hypothetical protein